MQQLHRNPSRALLNKRDALYADTISEKTVKEGGDAKGNQIGRNDQTDSFCWGAKGGLERWDDWRDHVGLKKNNERRNREHSQQALPLLFLKRR